MRLHYFSLVMKKLLLFASVAASVLGLSIQTMQAQSIYTSGHGDIGIAYDAVQKEFEPHWHIGAGAVVDGFPLAIDEEYAPVDLNARTSATRTSPTGLSIVIGLADGSAIYAAGSSTHQPNLGFAAEELVAGDWTGDITLTLGGWTLPSGEHFALYTTNLAGTSVVDRIFSTFAPGATDFGNSFPITPGDHLHFQFGFTGLGTYTLELTWAGTHKDDGLISATESFSIQVVPEPSTVGLLALAATAALTRRKRKCSAKAG